MEFDLLFFSSQTHIKKYGIAQSLHLSSSIKEYHKETEKRNARVPSIRFVFVFISIAFLFLVSSSRNVSFEQKSGGTGACEKADKVQGGRVETGGKFGK